VLLEADIGVAGVTPAQSATGERRSVAMLLLGILLGATALGIQTTIVVIVQGN